MTHNINNSRQDRTPRVPTRSQSPRQIRLDLQPISNLMYSMPPKLFDVKNKKTSHETKIIREAKKISNLSPEIGEMDIDTSKIKNILPTEVI